MSDEQQESSGAFMSGEDPVFTEERGPQQKSSNAPGADPFAEPILKYFEYAHLPERLQHIPQHFYNVAQKIMTLPRSAERTVALRKLLESKDAAVRAAL